MIDRLGNVAHPSPSPSWSLQINPNKKTVRPQSGKRWSIFPKKMASLEIINDIQWSSQCRCWKDQSYLNGFAWASCDNSSGSPVTASGTSQWRFSTLNQNNLLCENPIFNREINGKSYVSWFNLGESGKSIWVGPLDQSQASGMELCASWDLCNLVKGGITNTVRWLPGLCMG